VYYVKFPGSIYPRWRHIADLLLLGLWTSLAVFSTVAKADDWETTHFEVVVARVADDSSYSTGRKAWEAMLRAATGTEPWIDGGRERDYLTFEQKVEIEDYLHEAAKQLMQWGFDSPALEVHEPLIPRRAGVNKVYRLYLMNFSKEFEGESHDAGGLYKGGCGTFSKTIMKLNLANLTSVPLVDEALAGSYELLDDSLEKAKRYSGHELFHAVQSGMPFHRENCPVLPWITEGTAEALGWDLYEKITKKRAYEFGDRWGLRGYVKGPELPLKRDTASYRTSSLWRYLAELTAVRKVIPKREADTGISRPFVNKPGPNVEAVDYHYLSTLFKSAELPDTNNEAEAEIRWLHEGLHKYPYIKVGLDRILPDFYSVFAAYAQERPTSRDRADWVNTLCYSDSQRGGIPLLDLPHRSRVVKASFDLNQRGIGCFRINAENLFPRPLTINVQMSAPNKKGALQLHLGQAGGQFVGNALSTPAGCSGEGTCEISWTWMLKDYEPLLIVVTNVGSEPWNTSEQRVVVTVTTGGSINNIAPPPQAAPQSKPRNKPKPGPAGTHEAARQTAKDNATQLKADGVHAAKSGRALHKGDCSARYRELNLCGDQLVIQLSTVPGYSGVLSSVTQTGGFMKHMLGKGTLLAEMQEDIAQAEMLAEKDRDSRDGAEIELRIPLVDYGFTGTFNNASISVSKAGGGSYSASGPKDIDDSLSTSVYPPSGTVVIEEYSPQMLRGTFSGQLVRNGKTQAERIEERRHGIRRPTLDIVRTVQGRFWVAAPWQNDERYELLSPSELPGSIMDDFSELMLPGMLDSVPGLPGELSTGDGTNSVSGGSGMSKQSCSCSCAEQEEVESITEELSRRSDKSKGGVPDMQGINFGKMMCQIQCFEQYEACE